MRGCILGVEALFDDVPAEVVEEGLDVLAALCGDVVDHEGVLPDVHRDEDGEAGEMTKFVIAYPHVVEGVGLLIVHQKYPADSAHDAHGLEFCFPGID